MMAYARLKHLWNFVAIHHNLAISQCTDLDEDYKIIWIQLEVHGLKPALIYNLGSSCFDLLQSSFIKINYEKSHKFLW